MKKYGFTLAEILITLTIIGVVAALTIPNLMKAHQKEQIVVKLKKNYSVLSNATKLANLEYGTDWHLIDTNEQSTKEIFGYYKPYLKIAKDCAFTETECWSAEPTKTLNNQSYVYSRSYRRPAEYNVILEDGTSLSFDIWENSGNRKDATASNDENTCLAIFIDVNGPQGPNILGKDNFLFLRESDGNLVPAKSLNKECYKSTHASAGLDCTFQVLHEGRISYWY